MLRSLCILCVAACGSSPPPTKPPPAPASPPVATPEPDHTEADPQAQHDEIANAHRKIEEEQQDSFAAGCDEPPPHDKHQRCLPSCYATEPADTRAGKKVAGGVEIVHVFCEQTSSTAGDAGSATAMVNADELDPGKLAVRAVRGRFPSPHKKGSWQATVEASLALAQLPKLPRGDALVVSSGWRNLLRPVSKEKLRCVTVSHYTRSLRHALDGCGADGSLACEATGNAAARGINVVHYRLAEARHLESAGDKSGCQQAALEAIAVSRGLPRWRQYAKLNVDKWVNHAGYRTRYDGTLDEDTLFATAASLGSEAETVYAACGGNAPQTTPEQEQSFHTCW